MNIIIVGCGKVGQKLAEMLSRENEHNITVVDTRYGVISDTINRYDIMGVVGSGSSLDILTEAGVENADVLIAVTGSDELNLLTCLIAKKAGGCQTIARVRNPEYGKELHLFKEDLGLALIINPELTAANEIARLLRFPSAIQIDTFAKGRVEILKFRLPSGSPLDGMPIFEIGQKRHCDILVCGVARGDEAYIPGGDFVLKSGDFISLVASPKSGSEFFKKINVKTNRVKDTIIVGGGSTAYYLAKRLILAGINVKIIEQNPERCEVLCQALPKATVINGDGTDNLLLMEEGIEHAESFVALTNIDEENILLSLFAKSKTGGKLITKINRIAYDDVIKSLDFVRAMKNSLGSNIETMHYILDGKAEALEFRIKENSPISGVAIEKLNLKKNILIACINRGGHIIIPRGRDVIQTGDTVIVVAGRMGFKDVSDILE